MLIVMEDRNLHPLLELRLDGETFRRLDIFQIDAAECRLQQRYGLDELFGISRVHLDIEHIDVGEFLEEDSLTLHHRLGGKRTDGTQPQHGRAVGDHRDQIAARRIVHRLVRIFGDVEAGSGHAGRIGQRQVALVHHALGRFYP